MIGREGERERVKLETLQKVFLNLQQNVLQRRNK